METQKNTGCFWFSCSVSGEKPKNPVFFRFLLENQKTQSFFGFLLENQKNPRKFKIQKFRAPQKGFGFLVFWFPKALQKQKSKIFLRGPKLLDFLVFLGFFWFSNRNPKNHMFFLTLGGNPKNTSCFWFSCSVSGEKPKKTLCFLDFCWKTKNTKNHHVFFLISDRKPKKP